MNMCSINHDLKAIYIHIPKNGGSHVQNILDNCYGFKTIFFTRNDHTEFNGEFSKYDHKGCEKRMGFVNTRTKGILNYYITSDQHAKMANITMDQWDSYFKFSFVRNPYDKIISAWQFMNKIRSIDMSLIDFLNSKNECDNSIYSHAFIPQYIHLLDGKDELKINYIGDFYNLNEEIINVLKIIGVKKITHSEYIDNNIKINKTTEENYINYYNEEMLEIVNLHFDVDFKTFNYKKCITLDELNEDSKKYYTSRLEFNEKNAAILQLLNEENLIEKNKSKKVDKIMQINKNKKFIDFFNKNNIGNDIIISNFFKCVNDLINNPNPPDSNILPDDC